MINSDMDAKRIEAIYPVSPFQEALLLQVVEAQETYQARGLLSCALRGHLDIAIFEAAWNQIVSRQPLLRTSFAWKRVERPLQVVHRELKLSIEQQDWQQISYSNQEQLLKNYLDSELRQRLNPSVAGAARLCLCQTAGDTYRLICSYSRLLLDKRSVSLLLRELFVLYDGLHREQAPQPEHQPLYRDYLAWLGQQDQTKAETFWKTRLEGFNSASPIVWALMRTLDPGNLRGAEEGYEKRQIMLSSSVIARLRSMMDEHALTSTTLLKGAWALLLSRYSGEQEVIFGATVSARSAAPGIFETILGPLTNMLPVCVKVYQERVARAWLEELQMQQSSICQYGYSSLAQIREWINQPKDLPLFESSLILDGDSLDAFSPLTLKRIAISDMQSFGSPGLPLSIELLSASDLTIQIIYHRPSFDGTTIERALQHLETILGAISENPEAKLGELPLLGRAEQHQILVEWNRTESEYEDWRCIHELVEGRVETEPEAIAVGYEDRQISYGELNCRANRLGHYLSSLGVGPEVRVGICLERSPEMVVGLLGILKAGGAYVPLDPAYPLDRLAYMIEDAQVMVIISEQELLGRLPSFWGQIISIDADWEIISEYSVENPASEAAAENLAYVIYTSGSTGQPKGVMIRHGGLTNYLKWATESYRIEEGEGAPVNSSIGFDLTVTSLYGPLINGKRVNLLSEEEGIEALATALSRESEYSLVKITPAHLGVLAQQMKDREVEGRARVLVIGGEELRAGELKFWQERARRTRLINEYGPTETVVGCCVYEVNGAECVREAVPIGKPIANTKMYILGDGIEPVPVGVRGEIYISGAGLARGYLGKPELTAERFIPNRFGGRGERVYRTGDVGRYLSDGNIEFIGRIDGQVKVRGYRIELGEIEAALGEHRSVKQSAVIAREDERGGKRLAAYVVGEEGANSTELKNHLRERLPEYMVPPTIILLEAMPVTANGKIDRKRLPLMPMQPMQEDAGRQVEQECVGARTPTEEILLGIFKEVLKLDRVGVHDNFFELGGDSILSIQIISRANEAGLGLTPRQLFQHQSVAELAAVAGDSELIELEQGSVVGEAPLTPIQEWLFEGNDEELEHCNQAVMLEAKEKLDLEALGEVIRQLVKQHDVLRNRFQKIENGWRQICEEPDGKPVLEKIDISGVDGGLESKAIEEAAGEYQKGMNLEKGPLLRVVVFEGRKEYRQRLLIAAHHLVVDGVSWRILLGDLERGYLQARQGEEIKLGAKTTSYKRWAEKLKEETQSERVKKEASYWLALEGKRVRSLPVDKAGANTMISSKNVVTSLNEEETAGLLQEVARSYKTQINEALLCAVARAISEWSQEQTVLVEVEGHGREEIVEDVDLTRTVGWFTCQYPVRIELSDGNSVELLRKVKEQIREANRRGVYYGMLRYLSEEIDMRERLRNLPQAEISFNYLGQLDRVLSEGSLFRAAKESVGETRSRKAKRRHLIEINGSVTGGRLLLVWNYSENVYRRETIEVVAKRAMEVLRELVTGSRSATERPYTHSDFPLAMLDQRRLNHLIRAGQDIEDIYVLSPLQKGMLYHTLSELNARGMFEQLNCSLRGEVDFSAFKRAWQALIDRHSILRTSFEWEESDDPVQIVHRRVELPIEYMDWRAIASEEQESKFEFLLQADRERGFDLSKPPLMRLSLIQVTEDLYRFIWSQHHILIDGWSSQLMLQEVSAFYEAYQQGKELAKEQSPPYREYIAWLKRQDLQKAESYWRERLKGFNRPAKLWIDRGTGRANRESVYEEQQIKISREATTKLQAFARQHHLTMNTIVQSTLGLLLSKYSGEEDIIFGTTVSGRPVDLPGSESIIGPFINTLPVRMQIPFQSSLLSWLSGIQDEQIEYSQYSYSSLVEQYAEIPLGMPLYESILIYENYPVERSNQSRKRRLEISGVRAPVRTKFPLTVVSGPSSEWGVLITYDLRRFESHDIGRLLIHFQNIIEEIANNPEQPIWSLSPLSRTERNQLLAGWEGYKGIDSNDSYIHHRFEAQAEKTPDAVAVVFGEEQMTYGELNRRANQLADYLQELGVGPEVSVGIYLEPSPALLVGLLGVFKAGGTSVTPPAGYIDRSSSGSLFQELGTSLLLTQRSLMKKETGVETGIVRLDSDWEMISSRSGTNPHSRAMAENLAFITSTSGSGGEPRPVMITHRGLRNHLLGMQETVDITEEDRVLHKGSLHLDNSTLEMFWPLLAGARLVMLRPEADRNRAPLLDLIARQKITIAPFTPSFFSLLLREDGLERCNTLRHIILSGEALCRPVQERSLARMNVDLHNSYRVTEGSGAIASQICRAQHDREIVPIGQPVANTQIYLLDSYLQPVPAGVAGELWIGGDGLARGYPDRPELTAERFIPNPFTEDPGGRMFRTNDLARCLPDGKIEVLTRSEDQIKIKFGHIEPAIVESALMEYPGIDQAAVLFAGDTVVGARLLAYLACDADSAPSADALRRFLRERFPPQMIPSTFLTMDVLPLTIHGRIDRNTLAGMKLNMTDSGMALTGKGTPHEEMLCAIWNELFGVDEVSRVDNFFEMGGHSLLATQMMSRVREVFKVEIPLRSVFEEPTIEGLARKIEEAARSGQSQHVPPLVRAPRDERLPLSFAQQRLWFIEQLEPGKAIYNCPGGVRLKGRMDLGALENVINEMVRRHEVLRTRIEADEEGPVQVIDEWEHRQLEVEDLSGLEEAEREEEVRSRSRQEATTGFDLTRGPLLRVRVLKLGEEEHVVLFTMHHIVSDAWSMGVLVREVCELYEAMSEGKRSSLPELKIQYADYAYWQRCYLRDEVLEEHLRYWKKQLSGKLPVLDLAINRPRPSILSYRGAAKSIPLSAELSEPLKALRRQEGVTLFIVLLAAFKTLLYKYTGQEDIIVGTAALNRNRAEIEPLIGFFVNMLPMRTGLGGNPRFSELLKRVKEVALGAYAHQELPFEKLVEEIQPERGIGQTPLFNIAFGVQNASKDEAGLKGLKVSPVVAAQETVRFDLSLWMTESADAMRAGWIYSTDLFEEETIIRMHDHFETLLSSIATRPEAPLDELEMLSEAERTQRATNRTIREEYNYSNFRKVKPRAVALSED